MTPSEIQTSESRQAQTMSNHMQNSVLKGKIEVLLTMFRQLALCLHFVGYHSPSLPYQSLRFWVSVLHPAKHCLLSDLCVLSSVLNLGEDTEAP